MVGRWGWVGGFCGYGHGCGCGWVARERWISSRTAFRKLLDPLVVSGRSDEIGRDQTRSGQIRRGRVLRSCGAHLPNGVSVSEQMVLHFPHHDRLVTHRKHSARKGGSANHHATRVRIIALLCLMMHHCTRCSDNAVRWCEMRYLKSARLGSNAAISGSKSSIVGLYEYSEISIPGRDE